MYQKNFPYQKKKRLESQELKFFLWDKYKTAFQQRFPVSKEQGIRTVRNLETPHRTIEALSFGNSEFLNKIIVTNERTILFGIGNHVVEYSLEKWNVLGQKSYRSKVIDFEYDKSEKKSFVLLADGSLVWACEGSEGTFDMSIFGKLESSGPLKLKLHQEEGL